MYCDCGASNSDCLCMPKLERLLLKPLPDRLISSGILPLAGEPELSTSHELSKEVSTQIAQSELPTTSYSEAPPRLPAPISLYSSSTLLALPASAYVEIAPPQPRLSGASANQEHRGYPEFVPGCSDTAYSEVPEPKPLSGSITYSDAPISSSSPGHNVEAIISSQASAAYAETTSSTRFQALSYSDAAFPTMTEDTALESVISPAASTELSHLNIPSRVKYFCLIIFLCCYLISVGC